MNHSGVSFEQTPKLLCGSCLGYWHALMASDTIGCHDEVSNDFVLNEGVFQVQYVTFKGMRCFVAVQ